MANIEDPRISGKQRDALYELVCNHLAGIDELWLALGQQRDYEAAARLGPAYRADLRLLEDLGWAPQESGESFALTMTAGELAPLLQRLREEARELVAGDSNLPSREEDDVVNSRFATGQRACEAILASLGGGGIPDPRVEPHPGLAVSQEQREILRDLMAHRLFAIGGKRIDRAHEAGVAHLQLASEFSQDLRLMLDVSWGTWECTEPCELTMPPAELAWVLERMRRDAEAAIEEGPGESEQRCRPDEHRRRFRRAVDVCAELLAVLGQ